MRMGKKWPMIRFFAFWESASLCLRGWFCMRGDRFIKGKNFERLAGGSQAERMGFSRKRETGGGECDPADWGAHALPPIDKNGGDQRIQDLRKILLNLRTQHPDFPLHVREPGDVHNLAGWGFHITGIEGPTCALPALIKLLEDDDF